jgi:hypothetical protein
MTKDKRGTKVVSNQMVSGQKSEVKEGDGSGSGASTSQPPSGKYTKKPVTIEAMQFRSLDDAPALSAWFQQSGFEKYSFENPEGVTIGTLEGDHLGRFGDWIIRGVKGEFYPCKPDIFDATYLPNTPAAEPSASKPPLPDEAKEAPQNNAMGSNFYCMLHIAEIDFVNIADLSDRASRVGPCLERFYHENPDAPPAAGIKQVELRLGFDLLDGVAEPRRMVLAVALFKQIVVTLDGFARADADAEAMREQAAQLEAARRPADREDLSFQTEKGRDEPSEWGRRLKA